MTNIAMGEATDANGGGPADQSGYTRDGDLRRFSFEYSPENPPPLDILESKVFAVHSTAVLPKNGVMVAGARYTTANNRWAEDGPPSFRPTLHFSLGEVIQPQNASRDENQYAVVTPLKALKGQLMNLYPNDTFILGNYTLTEDATVLVPHGTDTTDLPDHVRVVQYDPQVGLRKAVDQLIKDKNGWSIKMQPEELGIGALATIKGVDINDVNFFKAMYEELPYVSYGTATTSERGNAFLFGMVDQAIQRATDGYDKGKGSKGTFELQFWRAFIEHNFTQLSEFLRAQKLPQEALNSFEEKSGKLRAWLNVIDVDLELRNKFDKTVSQTDSDIMTVIKAKSNNMAELRAFAEMKHDTLPYAPRDDKLSPSIIQAMKTMPLDELKDFIQNNEHIFTKLNMAEVYSTYAIGRWMLEKDQRSHEQGLDKMLEQALQQINTRSVESGDEPVFLNIGNYLHTGSNRLSTALHILQQPYVREYLQRTCDITFREGEPKTLEEIVRVHPNTAILFQPLETNFTEEQTAAHEFLKNIGQADKGERDVEKSLNDFRVAKKTASEIKAIRDGFIEKINTMTQPMNSARGLDEIPNGDTFSLYELLHKNRVPAELWRSLGLEAEYRQHFPQDDLFWGSTMSLLDIYNMLNQSKHK